MKKTRSFVSFLSCVNSSNLLSVATTTASIVLCMGAPQAKATTIAWDGNGVSATDLGTAVNWANDILPSPSVPDTMQWNGSVAGALSLVYSNAVFAGAAGNAGLNVDITAAQTGALNIDSGTNTGTLRMNALTVAAGAGAFSIGNGVNSFNLTMGGAAGTHTWTNNSSNAATIGSDVIVGRGGNGLHVLAVAGSGDWNFNTAFTSQDASNNWAITKAGTGVMNLTATNVLTGGLTVSNGTARLTGTNTSVGQISAGTVASQNGVLFMDGGTLNASKTTSPGLAIGTVASSAGFVKFGSTGALSTVSELHLGRGVGAYAAMTVGAGNTVTSGSWLVVALNNDRGVLNQTGGAITVSANRMTIGAGGNGSVGLANLAGGTFTSNAGVFVGENGTGTLNISGSAAVSMGNVQFAGSATSLAGSVNLLGGTLTTGSITKGASTANGVYQMNFNGGTLKPTASSPTFFSSLANTSAYVMGGGANIDTNGFDITVAQPLLAPTGSGVVTPTVATPGSGYLDTPVVTITRGAGDNTGVGATAVATVSSGAVTGIVITNPGVDYTAAPVFTLSGGGAAVAATITGVAPSVNTSGGLAKAGNGILTLSGSNTYNGATSVGAGKLSVTGSLAAGSAVSVSSGATLGGTGAVNGSTTVASGGILEGGVASAGKLTLAGLTFSGAADVNLGMLSNYVSTPAVGAGAVNLSGGTGAVVIHIASLGTATSGNTYKLLDYSSLGGTGFSGFSLASLPSRAIGNLVNTGTGINLSLTSLDFLKWTGSLSNDWNTAATNWKLNSTNAATNYINSPGDAVVFDDSSSNPNVDINTVDVTPTSVTFNNNLNDYYVQGSKSIAGLTGIVKNNGAAVTLALANTYSGGTTLNAGTLNINNSSAIGTGVLTIAGGTIDANGVTLTTNNAQNWNSDFTFTGTGDLNMGSGAVTMSASRAITTNGATLTVGGIVSGTGMSLTKNGPGTLVLGGVNTYNSGTNLNAGTLQLNQTTGAAATGTFNVAGGTLVFNPPANNFGYAPAINLTANTAISKIGNFQINYTGVLTGTGNVVDVSTGASRLYMNGTVSGVSQFNVSSGAMGFDLSIGNRGGSAPVNVSNGASLWFANATNAVTNNITLNGGTGQGATGALFQEGAGTPTISGTVALASGDSSIGGNTAAAVVSITGQISGPGALTKIGANKYTFSGANTYTGATTINAGILTAGVGTIPNVSGAFGVNSAVSLGNIAGAAMDITGFNTQIGSLSGGGATGGNITLGAATLTVGADNTSPAAYAGAISGTGGLAKIGTGALILAGANSNTGDITISGGTLVANRGNDVLNPVTSALGNPQVARNITVNTASALNFAKGDTLGGSTSTIAPTLVINAGGVVTNTTGFFTTLGPITLNGGTLTTTGGAVLGYQSYSLAGDVTVTGSAVSTISVTGGGNAFNGIHLGTNTTFNVADVTGSSASDLDVSAPLINRNQSLAGSGGLTKSGAGTMTMTGVNAYTGDTIITGGTLSISNANLADAADVRITTGAKLNLTFSAGTPDTIDELYIDGVQQAVGTWGAIGSGAAHTTSLITGTGMLNVTTGVTSAYTAWESSYSLGSGSENGDPDADGIKNLMEYVLGGIPTGAGASDTSILPTQALDATNLVLTFHRSDLSESEVTVKVQWSTDMVTWNDFATIGATSALPAVQVTEDSPTTALDTVVVTIPRSGHEVGGKLFGRVIAVK
ncbi:MAG: autotransporter-associated beta strand repeat-containing protein [Luteolibacter sp.]